MKPKMKYLLGLLLGLIFMLVMSLTAYADDDSPYASLKNTTTVVHFDSKDWYLIDYNSSMVTLLSKECVGASKYNESGSFVEYSDNPTVKTAVDDWYNINITADAKTAVSGDGMFLLTRDQAKALSTDVRKCSQASGAGTIGWWLCTVGLSDSNAAFVSFGEGLVLDDVRKVDDTLGVRPALKLNLSSVIFSSESKTFSLKPAHTHSFTYSASGATITATCTADDCDLPVVESKHVATLTIAATGGTYDGTTAYGATITDTYGIQGDAKVKYQKKTVESSYDDATEIAPTDAGDYKASITVGGATASVEYTIAQADPTANAPTGLTATYGQTLANVSLEGKNPEGNTPGTWAWVNSTQSVGNVVTPAATFKASFTPTSSNYKTVENVDVAVTVSKAAPTAPTDLTATYGQTLADVTLPNGWTWADSTQSVGNVGSNTFKANFAGDDNHNAASNVDVAVTVSKANAVTATVTANSRTYDGTEKPLVTVTGTATGGTMQYALGTAAEATEPYTTSIPTKTNAGTYYVWYKVVGDINHNNTNPEKVVVTINRKGSSVKIVPTAMQLTYNGQGQELVEAGKVNGGTMYYALGKDGTTAPTSGWRRSIPTGINVGTYYVWYKAVGDNNHNDSATAYVTVTINKADITPSVEMAGWTVGMEPSTPAVSGNTGKGAVTYTYKAKGTDTYTETAPTAPGEYTLKATIAETDNYKGAIVERNFTIAESEQQPEANGEAEFDTPVGNIQGLSEDNKEQLNEQLKEIASDDAKTTKDGGEDVTVSLTATGMEDLTGKDGSELTKDQIQTKKEQEAIKEIAQETVGDDVKTDFMDISITQTERPYTLDEHGNKVYSGSLATTKELHDLKSVLDITIRYNMTGRYNASIARFHGGIAQLFTKLTRMPSKYTDATFYVEGTGANTLIHIFTSGCSTYAVLTSGDSEIEAEKATVTKAPTAKSLWSNGLYQELVKAGKAKNGTMVYALGTKDAATEAYSTAIPTAKDTGTYYVWYKAEGDDYHADSEPKCVEVTIREQADYPSTPSTPTYCTVTFKVVNGSWDDGEKTDKKVLADRLTANQIPAVGNKPAEGYKEGSWDVVPDTTAVITTDTTYTYTYVEKPKATITKAPEAKDLTANGTAQELITTGQAQNGTMKYAVGINAEWSTSIPTATDPGTYYVWYMAEGDEGYESTEAKCILVSIKYAPGTLVANGEEQELVKGGSAQGGIMVYLLGTDDVTAPAGVWTDKIPTGKDPGDYYVWYKVQGDENHNDTEPQCVKVTIVPDSQVDQLIEMINTLPETVTLENEDLVEALRSMYDALTDNQKKLIPEEDLRKLEAAEERIEELKEQADREVADMFTTAVNAVPGNKAGEGKGLIDNATAIYETMTDAQKALVSTETMDLYNEELAAFTKDRQFRSGDGYYKVLSNGDVTYLKPASRDITDVLVPNQVKKGKFLFKVIKVSNNAFRNCKNLKWAVISKNVYVFGQYIFARDENLTKVRVLGTGFKSGKVTDAFVRAGDGGLTVKVPGSKVDEYRELFINEGGLDGKVGAA